MKRIINNILAICCLVVQSYAQNVEKKTMLADLQMQKIPIYFPLSKDGFKRLSSPFGMRKHPILKTKRFHPGLDLAAAHGTPIYASANGNVLISEYSKIYGNYVIINHHFGYKTLYGHMSKVSVKRNQKVKQGTIIGYVGSTGRSTGPHLHFEILKEDKKIDPFKYWVKTLYRKKKLLRS